MQPLIHAYVGLGSNVGDRARYLVLAVRGILDAGMSIKRLSSIYETMPVGLADQPQFLNMVARIDIEPNAFSPEEVMARLLKIEYQLGRRREVPGGPRVIDLDLLLYGGRQIQSEFLTLPHPRMHERRFVLAPLAELAPLSSHPTLGRTIADLLLDVRDDAAVERWRPPLAIDGRDIKLSGV